MCAFGFEAREMSEKFLMRMLELVQEDHELHLAVLDLLGSMTAAQNALAAYRLAKTHQRVDNDKKVSTNKEA